MLSTESVTQSLMDVMRAQPIAALQGLSFNVYLVPKPAKSMFAAIRITWVGNSLAQVRKLWRVPLNAVDGMQTVQPARSGLYEAKCEALIFTGEFGSCRCDLA